MYINICKKKKHANIFENTVGGISIDFNPNPVLTSGYR